MSYKDKKNIEIENELSVELGLDLYTIRAVLGEYFGQMKDYERGMCIGLNQERRGFWLIGLGQLCEQYREFHELNKGGVIEDVVS